MAETPDNKPKHISKARFREDLKFYEYIQPADYIRDRLIDKIRLYFKFSRRCERAYRFILFFTLFFGALVPVVLNWDYLADYKIGNVTDVNTFLATSFSIIVILLLSLETTFSFRERLKNYKKTEDQLTHELYLYQSGTEPYNLSGSNKDSNFQLLVLRVESIIKEEREDTIEKATAEAVRKSRGEAENGV
jgi:hypothetical protein